MGFWHTGYLDLLDLGPPGVAFGDVSPPRPPPPPVYACPWCTSKSGSPDELQRHVFRGHPEPRPLLFFRGRECGRTPVNISTVSSADEWTLLQAEDALLNGRPVAVDELPGRLAGQRNSVCIVRLSAGRVHAEFRLQFEVPSDEDLSGVDGSLVALTDAKRLDVRAIEDYIRSCRSYETARPYYDGFAQYFYGVLARERSPDSGLQHDEYRDRFESSATSLARFDRAPALAVAALVAFHFNQFTRVRSLSVPGTRLSGAADRLLACLRGEEPPTEVGERTTAGLDAFFTDAETERVVRWVCIPLVDTSAGEVQEMERYAQEAEAYDRVKLQIVAAEYHLRMGNSARCRSHVDALLHNDVTDAWARSMRVRLAEGGNG